MARECNLIYGACDVDTGLNMHADDGHSCRCGAACIAWDGMGWDGDEFAHLCLATPAIPIFKNTCKSTTKGVLEQATTYRRRWAALPAAGVGAEP